MFKKAALMVLVVMVLAFAAGTSQAQSVAVSPAGLGDSLIYAYYTTKGSVNLFNIVNTDATNGVKARIVFRAGKNSEEILDFNICFSRNDVYTAFIADNGAGNAAICGGVDTDTPTSATVPVFPGCLEFRTASGSTLTQDDMKEGYFEVLGLSAIPGFDKNATNTTACPAAFDGTLRNCIRTTTACANWFCNAQSCLPQTPAAAPDVNNVLFGQNLIVLADGGNYASNATAFENTAGAAFVDPGPGAELSIVNVADAGCGIEFVIQKTAIYAPFDVISGFGETEIILNFPTRKACHEIDDPVTPGDNVGTAGAGNAFNCVNNPTNTLCLEYQTPIFARIFDDKENELAGPGCTVSPCPEVPGTVVRNEVNILKLGGSSIFTTGLGVNISTGTFTLGWTNISLVNLLPVTGPPNAPFGLPALAFVAESAAGFTYMLPTQYIAAP